MKKIFQKSLMIAAVAGLAVSSASAQSSGSLKIGIVDLQRVFESYYKTVQADDASKTEAETMRKEHQDMVDDFGKAQDQYKKLINNANDMAVSKDERDKAKAAAEDQYKDVVNKKDAIDQYDRGAMARLQEEKRQKRDQLVQDIKDHLTAQAKSGGFNLVFDISGESANMVPVAIYATNLPDLSESLLKELNAGAPASFVPPTAEAIKAARQNQ